MIFQAFVLFIAALLGGMAGLAFRRPNHAAFQHVNVFSGGYLFAITVLHLLPELFSMAVAPQRIGLYLLIGFFLQLLLEVLSGGVEHGHVEGHTAQEHSAPPLTLVLALCIHASLDGVILSTPHTEVSHGHVHAGGLLLGVLLHKIPEAFALTSVLSSRLPLRSTVIGYLILFSLASPLGLWGTHYLAHHVGWATDTAATVWALISGSFLYIATTIFFEASPNHHLNIHKFIWSLAGASLAVVFELLL